jgi:pyridoxamine 5'-phosphate oxidase
MQAWYDHARGSGVRWPASCCLATADPDGRPSARMILFKEIRDDRVTFATNFGSDKAADLDANPHAALVLFWPSLDRQIRLEGAIERLDDAGSDAIHDARPRPSQISAWASRQSAPIESHEAFLERRERFVRRFDGVDPVPRPEYWGGYALLPDRVEFWEAREDRAHRRELYVRAGTAWTVRVLQP